MSALWINYKRLAVAKFGIALPLGGRDREFKSLQLDHISGPSSEGPPLQGGLMRTWYEL